MDLSARLRSQPGSKPGALLAGGVPIKRQKTAADSEQQHAQPSSSGLGAASTKYVSSVTKANGSSVATNGTQPAASRPTVPPVIMKGSAFDTAVQKAVTKGNAADELHSTQESVLRFDTSSKKGHDMDISGASGAADNAQKHSAEITRASKNDPRNLLQVLHRLRQNPASTEFVYLRPYEMDPTIPPNPYHLEVVDHEDVGTDFYTLSAFGVTHFENGRPSFTELDQWKRESYLFNAVIKIPVFKKFRLWKTFKVWRMTVRYGKINYCRRQLKKHLFWLDPRLSSALLKVREHAAAKTAMSMFQLKESEVLSLSEFVSSQAVYREELSTHLRTMWASCLQDSRQACADTMEALEERLFGSMTDSSGTAAAGGASSPRATAFKYTVQASKRVEHERLFHFLRLSDYIVHAAMHGMVSDSVSKLLAFLRARNATLLEKGTNPAVVPAFLTEIELQPGNTVKLNPGYSEYETEIDLVVSQSIATVSSLPRLQAHRDVRQFVELHDEAGNDTGVSSSAEVIQADTSFQKLQLSIRDELRIAFNSAEEYRETFGPYCEMLGKNQQLDVEELRKGAEEGEISLEDFRADIVKFNEEKDDIASVRDTKPIGVLEINAEAFKGFVSPSPLDCLDKLEKLLPELALKKQKALLEIVNSANSKLNAKPQNPSDFVNVLGLVDEMNDRRDELQEMFDEVERHYALMKDHSVPVPELDKAGLAMLVPEFSQLKNNVDVAQSLRDENVQQWNGQLDAQIASFGDRIDELKVLAQDQTILEETEFYGPVIDLCRDLREKAQELQDTAKEYERNQKVFGAQVVRYPELDEAVSDISLKLGMWESLQELQTVTSSWTETLMDDLDPPAMEAQVQRWFKTAMRADRELPNNKVAPRLKNEAVKFKDLVPICADLRNESLQERHWEKIEETLGQKLERDPDTWTEPFTLGVLLRMNAFEHQERIQQISTEATQEAALQQMLDKVRSAWVSAEFALQNFKEQKEVFILGGIDEIQQLLDDSMVTMGTITASRFVSGIRSEVEKMEQSLNLFSETLDEWLGVQRNWMYLEPIFSAPDIQRQLPTEAKQFLDIDKNWKVIMKRSNENPNALKCGTQPGLLNSFQQWNETLDRIQKSLEDYLETKRMAFPRFYFLSNDELLEILAQTRNVQAVQPHMSKCFDAIKSLDFGKDPKSVDIYGMFSPEGEEVSLGKKPTKARGNVENWLSEVEKSMVRSLRSLAKAAVVDYVQRPRTEWVMEHAAQIIIMGSQIYWCKAGTESLDKENSEELVNGWLDLTVNNLNDLCKLVRGELTSLQRAKLVALITIDVHNRDIIEIMLDEKVFSEHDFGWQMRLRYYWDDNIGEMGDCEISQVQAKSLYAYEYLGASMRLVITPLTDRCYMTLTGALHLKLGGAPAGPAGTGKTESTKDLAKALGTQCVVFNCGDNLDYKFMGKFFKGLAQCGAWACFDEFNRINIEVLSVIAQQIITIQIALRANMARFMFEGVEIRLIQTFGVFITMNPGYAGRTELPDNLKALFRPMAMMIPDYALVAEVMLFSEGFESAKILSRKMVKLYKLSSEQLSQQDHYDFGMRAVKSVLVMAGSLKRANPDLSEDIVLIRAMRDSNIPKFLSDDVILFNAIVQDLFPGVEIPAHDVGDLKVAIEDTLAEGGLQIVDAFTTKIVQLFETFSIRFGVMTVGPTGGGKSTVVHTLANALTLLRERNFANPDVQKTHIFTLNPKSISMGELYGNFNLLTNEWTDGLGSTIIRNANNDTTNDRKYIIFDGPVDAIWIENMNTVLDDNRTLCLPNGERIKLNGTTMRMLFEVEDLRVASPATVSRCGMVWVPPDALGLAPYVQTWLNRALPEGFTDESKDALFSLFEQTVPAAIQFVRRNCREPIPTVDINLVTGFCRMLQSLLRKERGVDIQDENFNDLLKKLFLWSLIWSVGANLHQTSREKFSDYVRDELGSVLGRLPNSGLVYDYYVSVEENAFKSWNEIVPEFKFNSSVSFFEMLVPTMDTVRYSYCQELLLDVDAGMLLVGDSGTGKSVIVSDCLNRLEGPKNLVPFIMAFSAQTSSNATQEMVDLRLEKKRKGVFGAPSGKKMVCFVDDVNMPQREVYGAQPPVELLRQVVDHVVHYRPNGGFYDRKKFFWKNIIDTTFVAACGPPGGGRNPVTARFFRHFNMLNICPSSDDVLKVIFSSMLGGFVEDFPADIKGNVQSCVKASLEVYRRMESEMLPTPSKSHYTFNLRDLSKVFQGILSVKAAVIPDLSTFVKLWCHENMRVFMDRLINSEDKEWFTHLLHELLKRHFSIDWDHDATFSDSKPIIFGDFMKPGLDPEDRVYEYVDDPGKLPRLFETYLDDYNVSTPKTMNLVFFMDAVQHISRLTRIMRQPRGNALLVGLGGSGKQSLTRMASFISDFKCSQIELKRGYGLNEFREDIKELFLLAGVERKPTVFLFTDSQIVSESFLEDVNSILNSGDVPNLFAQDEKDRIVNDLRDLADKAGRPTSRDGVYQFFVDGVRDNLHVVLAMSPVGDAFRTRCRMFPSLINCCTIDWYLEWPKEALVAVASRFLDPVEVLDDDFKKPIAEMCVTIHQSVGALSDRFFNELRRKFYTTPKSYLDLIGLYIDVLAEKKGDLAASKDRFVNGLQKMAETNSVIDTLQAELTELQPVLKEKSEATQVLLAQVTKDEEAANKVREVVSNETALVEKQTEEVLAIQADAQKDLDEALPALDAAVSALNSLTKGDITEVKSFAKPPPLVQTTMEAVCTLLGEKTDWDAAKKVLGDSNFMQRLLTFDKDNIPQKLLKSLKKYIDMPDFTADSVGKVSKAAKGMCMWCVAMDVYARVAKEVEPKRARLKEANDTLAEAQAKLKEKQDQLSEVEEKVAALQAQLKKAQDDQQSLKDQSELCEGRLQRAGVLTGALGDEAVIWQETSNLLDGQLQRLIGDAFLACSCVSYFGAFTGAYREEIVSSWIESCKELNIPVSDDFTLQGVLANPVEVRDWNIAGLPTDSVSIDNGVLVMRGKRWPLMIDPQMQANRWIRNSEEKRGLRFIKLSDPNFLRTLENSIRIGNPVLLEDLGEDLDPALEPVLLKQLFKQGGRLLIRLGDSDVDYDPNFRFYMTTKLPNPHYMPEICIKTTIINFTVTAKGLEDQLLGDVVRQERPDLEQQKDRLVVSMANDKKQLAELQDKVLKLLKESEGNILDNKSLISTLEQSKITSTMIGKRVKEAEETEIEINTAREKYRTVARRGSILYFVIADLASIDPMYQYSLTYFQKLFNYCIEVSEKSDDLDKRLEILMHFITEFMYNSVCRGLFEAHKPIYSFLICTSILRDAGDIGGQEWNFLLRGAPMTDAGASNPASEWLKEPYWNMLRSLDANVASCKGIIEKFKGDLKEWRAWAEGDAPHEVPFPEPLWSSLDHFQRMLVIKCFRPEKIVFATQDFVREKMGRQYTESPPFTLADIYKDTSNVTPVIFVLSTGADPTASLLRFAEDRDYSDRLHVISLGQGQGPIAEKLIASATRKGDWVCLMNCHLATSWMGSMEKMIEGFSAVTADVHPDFRLWLTSMPSTTFPVAVLQNGIKLTNEPPKGVRANVLRSISDMKEEEWEGCSKPNYWKKLCFSLSFFHAVVQERRKYGPLGWNIRYEFNTSDIECARMNLKMFIEDHGELPWEALVYVTGQINYGGRVTDDLDRRCLMCILGQYYLPDVVENSDYKFSASGTYYAPEPSEQSSVVEYIKGFPLTDNPELFGMHENANIAFQLQETSKIIDTVLMLQPRVGGGSGGGKTQEEVVDEMAQKFLDDLPSELDRLEEAGEGMFIPEETGAFNCLDTVLLQESDRYNRLLSTMRKSLAELRKAIKGLVVMSGELEAMFTSFVNNQVPELWSKVAYPSLKPLSSWILDMYRRVAFMRDWMKNGTPKSFWLPGFYFPQGFMTGALQSHARRYTIPIDTLNFGFKVLPMETSEDVSEAPEDGIFIDGLFLEAARWDAKRRRLATSLPGRMFHPMPVIHFIPYQNYTPPKENYECPLYKTNVRAGVLSTTGQSTNFVLQVSLPTDKSPDFWVLQGTAMITMMND